MGYFPWSSDSLLRVSTLVFCVTKSNYWASDRLQYCGLIVDYQCTSLPLARSTSQFCGSIGATVKKLSRSPPFDIQSRVQLRPRQQIFIPARATCSRKPNFCNGIFDVSQLMLRRPSLRRATYKINFSRCQIRAFVSSSQNGALHRSSRFWLCTRCPQHLPSTSPKSAWSHAVTHHWECFRHATLLSLGGVYEMGRKIRYYLRYHYYSASDSDIVPQVI